VGVVEGIMTMVGCVLLMVLRSQRKSQKNKDISL